MTSQLPQHDSTSSLLRAYVAIERLEAKVALLERARNEPIAIVGMSCRFPGGANDPQAFWQLLQHGADTTTDIPADRWDADASYDPDPDATGKTYTRRGAFISNVDQFDAAFFGISPREAAGLDPQQRLLLEVSWEALEHAGQAPEQLFGSQTGVFVGLMNNDYAILLAQTLGLAHGDAYAATGSDVSFAAGRLSYILGLQGPSMVLTTACSSSLVAAHLACQSLRNGECDMALAGGVNLMLVPDGNILLSRLRAIAPDGRCKTFAAAADGYGRGEGCGMVVLKRLSDALAAGDPILALIRGSAVNHDGPSGGLTVPNGVAQRALLTAALQRAGVAPAQVGYVEAHGTGTPLGDPIEVNALAGVYGAGRDPAQPLLIGSVKTNCGHLESAAGIIGLIKVVLSLQHGMIPAHLHFQTPNPHIDWQSLPVRVPTSLTPWPAAGPRIAGVSSFGLSGINAHALIEEAPRREPAPAAAARPVHLLTLSAKSDAALRQLAQRYAEHFQADTPEPFADLCFTANTGRSHFAHRLAVVAPGRHEAATYLNAFAAGQAAPAIAHGVVASGRAPKIAFLFSGQGAQYSEMGRELYQTQPAFRAALDRCAELLMPHLGLDLRAVLYGGSGIGDRGSGDRRPETGDQGLETAAVIAKLASRDRRSSILDPRSSILDPRSSILNLDQTRLTQPALFALEYALAELWRSWGVQPALVIGHSVGEYVAACLAGVFSLEDGLRLIAERGRLMQQLTEPGAMAAVRAAPEVVADVLAGQAGTIAIAALNGPQSVVISGQAEAVAAACQAFETRGIRTQRLDVSRAFHSPLLDPMLDAFEAVARSVTYAPPRIGVITNLRGALAEGDDLQSASYWRRHAQEAVQFDRGMQALYQQGADLFIEIGPHPVLLGMGRLCLPDGFGSWLPSLRKGQPEWQQLLSSLGQAYAAGAAIDWTAVDGLYARQKVRLPTYAFQRKRCWIERPPAQTAGRPTEPNIVGNYYDRMAEIAGGAPDSGEGYEQYLLTFPPFPEVVPGFSWLLLMAQPQAYPEHSVLVHNAQQQMRDVLFQRVDFAACRRVLDFGCGYASDLIALGKQHRHLELHGYTLSPGQARIGNQKILAQQLQDRVKVYNADSTRHDFPSQYDIVLGFEVAVHIKDKDALFANIDRHLNTGGLVLLADVASNAVSPIVHEETSSYLITRERWCDLLSRYKLKVIRCLDASQEVSNFLADPHLDEHLEQITKRIDPIVLENYQSYINLGKMFQKDLVSYLVFAVQKDPYLTREEIYQLNQQALSQPAPYAVAQNGASAWQSPSLPGRRPDLVQSWFYTLEWRPQPQPVPQPSAPQGTAAGHWLVFADQGPASQQLAALVSEHGESSTLVFAGATYAAREDGHYCLDPADPAHYAQLLAELAARQPACRGIVHLWSLDHGSTGVPTAGQLQAAQVAGSESVLHLVQALLKAGSSAAPLWLVTAGAQTLGGQRGALAQAPLWGLGRGIALEHPQLWGGLVDLDPQELGASITQLWQELQAPADEEQIAFRAGARYVARLSRCPAQAQSPIALEANATYLVTGGLGALGLHSAGWLVEHGARHLVLLGRRGLPDRSAWAGASPDVQQQIAAVQALEARGAQVVTFSADVADRQRMHAVFAEIGGALPPLKGVVHAAGWAPYEALADISAERFRAVLSPKVAGSWILHELTQGLDLDFFVCFSSIAALWGSAGLAHYAAANAFLDGLAHERRAHGMAATSINWGPWAGDGMSANEGGLLARLGLVAMAPEQALHALGQALRHAMPQIAVADIRWETFKPIYESQRRRSLLRQIEQAAGAPAVARPPSTFLKQLDRALPGERYDLLVRHICQQAAGVLKLDAAEELDPGQPLRELGLDSLMAVELRNTLELSLEHSFPATLLIDYPTIAALARYLAGEILKLEAPPAAAHGAQRPLGERERYAAELDELSEEAMAALLAEELASVRRRRQP